jgi:hypothetical protein
MRTAGTVTSSSFSFIRFLFSLNAVQFDFPGFPERFFFAEASHPGSAFTFGSPTVLSALGSLFTFCGFTVGSMSPAITPVTGAKLAINHLPSQGKSMISIAGVVVVVVVVLAVGVGVSAFFPLVGCFLSVVAAVVVALAGVVTVAFAGTVCC